jgi:hypothetical protein
MLMLPPYSRQFEPYFVDYGEYGGKKFMHLLKEPKY